MRKKFGGYTIDATRLKSHKRRDGLLETTTILEGDIEIGIEIDPMTWRGDWLREFVFGKDEKDQWFLLNVENHLLPGNPPSRVGQWAERNMVTAVWCKRDEYRYFYN